MSIFSHRRSHQSHPINPVNPVNPVPTPVYNQRLCKPPLHIQEALPINSVDESMLLGDPSRPAFEVVFEWLWLATFHTNAPRTYPTKSSWMPSCDAGGRAGWCSIACYWGWRIVGNHWVLLDPSVTIAKSFVLQEPTSRNSAHSAQVALCVKIERHNIMDENLGHDNCPPGVRPFETVGECGSV
jgi:hypothetical protein